jgi:bis(5'-nucleosyl)-tetraphosphatase (symmetrical)
MCFCDPYGKLELNTKSGPNTPPEGFSPWYLAANKKNIKPGIIFGHWASSMGQADSPNVFSLDTGCVWGGFLTAMRLEDRKRYSISSAGYI